MGYYANTFDCDVVVRDLPFELFEELQENGFHFDVMDEGTYLTYISGKWSWINDGIIKLAPHVIEPARIYFQGEDSEQWMVKFDNNTLSFYEAQIIYNDWPSEQIKY